jgi:hypothetical protein
MKIFMLEYFSKISEFSSWDKSEKIPFLILIIGLLNLAIITVAWVYKVLCKFFFVRRNFSEITRDYLGIEAIKNVTKFYVEPDCCSIDSSQVDEMKELVLAREPLFKKIDVFINSKTRLKFLFLLADSGMGKSSSALNYLNRNHQKWFKRKDIYFIPLGIKGIDKEIESISTPSIKILILDAFDEDAKAIFDGYEQRIEELVIKCQKFKKVIITCRSQFFPSDEKIPKSTGLIKITPRRLGENTHYEFSNLYLAHFTDKQINKYLNKRFSIFKWKLKSKAKRIIGQIPLLSIRPMILTHILDFVDTGKYFEFQKDLYQVIIESWIKRESAWYSDSFDLKCFSEKLALYLITNRNYLNGEFISYEKLAPIASAWGLKIEDWQISGKSLLNRDAIGNYKFAHRSILEYLFVKSFLDSDMKERYHIVWSDQMKLFLLELVRDEDITELNLIDLRGLEIENIDFSHKNLKHANFGKATIRNCDFSNSICNSINFLGAQIINCKFNLTVITHSCFINTYIESSDFSNSLSGGSIALPHEIPENSA